ncbi:MAG: hypothetical protein EZS28_017486 [Streblomastix strix]|uniref:Uncharacterized protein n=1 Tax=Streblomastix strix TaxID=222440 RepID=A0A5J4VWH2_9EUKA|nr:MAG: hypothetical protein EZS28_017486 [Streblomastix strix]
MMINAFKLQKVVVGTTKALNPDIRKSAEGAHEKRYMPTMTISISWEYLIKVLDLLFKAKSKQIIEYLKTLEGLDYQMYAQIITQKLQVNQNMYFYDEDNKVYYQDQKIIFMENETEQSEIPTVDILIVQARTMQHDFSITNKEALTRFKFCPFCYTKGFDIKRQNYTRDYERHIVKCEFRGGKRLCLSQEVIHAPFLLRSHQRVIMNDVRSAVGFNRLEAVFRDVVNASSNSSVASNSKSRFDAFNFIQRIVSLMYSFAYLGNFCHM